MFGDYGKSLLRSGIIEAKAGEKAVAARYLNRAVTASRDHDLLAEAWYWLSVVTDDVSEKRAMLENCLAHNMRHPRARRALAVIDGKLKEDEIIDPDKLPPAPAELTAANADRFMCPKCGARMAFAPDGSSLVCDYCTRREGLETAEEAEEKDFLLAMATARGHRKPVSMQVFHCQGCGAEFILPPGVISTNCAYCDSPHVVSLGESRELLQPEGVIPHAFDQKQVNRILVDWVKQHGVKPQGQVDFPRGVYLPIWTFDIGGEIAYSGDKMQAEGEVFRNTKNVVHVKDSYPVYINDLPVPASRKIAAHFARLLPSFDLSKTRDYDPRYLASWAAEVYDVPMADASLDARQQAYVRYKRIIALKVPLFNLRTSSAGLTIDSFKLVLLPVWITEIPFDGKVYAVLINGQNGVVAGDTPAKPKIALREWLDDLFDD
ncbi:MAG: hypothetical protein Kow002_13680 [Anaerolineales bacterium]